MEDSKQDVLTVGVLAGRATAKIRNRYRSGLETARRAARRQLLILLDCGDGIPQVRSHTTCRGCDGRKQVKVQEDEETWRLVVCGDCHGTGRRM